MWRALIGCETSGKVRKALRAVGVDAWSCDVLPSDDRSPFHIQADVLTVLEDGWDLLIAHPPCTYLANSGVRWLYKQGTRERVEERWRLLEQGAAFFSRLITADIPLIALENPIQHKHAKALIGIAQSQVIQPWMFGHRETKATGLWLKGLPHLTPTNIVGPPVTAGERKAFAVCHRRTPSADRWKLRSETYQGIADAMATQWALPLLRKSV